MAKIKHIHVKNIKSVVEQDLALNGCSAIITGGNNKGKTTILNALIERLNSEKPEMVIRQGEDNGSYTMELTNGDKILWNAKSDKVTLVTPDNLCSTSIREISKKYFGEKFDIDVFLHRSPKEQAAMLQKLVGLDFAELDTKYKAFYVDRAFFNRKIKQVVYEPTKPENQRVSVSALTEELKKAQLNNKERGDLGRCVSERKTKIAELENQLSTLKHTQDVEMAELENSMAIDTKPIEEKIANASKINTEIDKYEADLEQYKQYQADVEKAKRYDDELNSITEQKKQMLDKSELPDGISIEDGKVLVDGFALDKKQISLSKLYITALKLASLSLKEVKTLYFDASPLDKHSLEEIQTWANENGLQLLIEKPDYEGGEIEYHIISEAA